MHASPHGKAYGYYDDEGGPPYGKAYGYYDDEDGYKDDDKDGHKDDDRDDHKDDDRDDHKDDDRDDHKDDDFDDYELNLILGTNKDDSLEGSRDGDLILAGNGDDYVLGQPPAAPFPDDDDDVLFGQNGDDTLNGVGGDDKVSGGNGDDVVQGGVDDDKLYGNNGDDILYGRFIGAEDGPTNNDNAGDDTLKGGRGDDKLLPGDGSNVLSGGKGEDAFIFDEESGFLRDDGSDDTNTITDLEPGDRLVFVGYTEPDFATGGDGSIDNASEAEIWLQSLKDAGLLSFEDGNLEYAANGDTLVIEGVEDFDEAVDLFGDVKVVWTDDYDVFA